MSTTSTPTLSSSSGSNANAPELACCIVWYRIPFLSALMPVIGHLSITRCDGSALDFSESRFVSQDNASFGPPVKYWRLEPARAQRGGWDKGLERAAALYRHRTHWVLWSNCHSFVCEALNQMEYDGRTDYRPLGLWFQVCRHARYVSLWAWLRTWSWYLWAVALVACFLSRNASILFHLD